MLTQLENIQYTLITRLNISENSPSEPSVTVCMLPPSAPPLPPDIASLGLLFVLPNDPPDSFRADFDRSLRCRAKSLFCRCDRLLFSRLGPRLGPRLGVLLGEFSLDPSGHFYIIKTS